MLGPQNDDDSVGLLRLQVLAVELYALQPSRCPSFVYCWLELIANRAFLPHFMASRGHSLWPIYTQLLIALLRFLEPYLRQAKLLDSVRGLYKGVLRVLLVLLHDYPDYLCHHFYHLCDAIPPSCIQLRNLILSAFPQDMKLPDPFTPDLKLEQLGEYEQHPYGELQLEELVPDADFRSQLDTAFSGTPDEAFI